MNTARSGNGAVPPPCGRGPNFGINGSTNSHSASGTNRSDNASSQAKIIADYRQITT
ncbi:hypothetical protein [Amycolatopsis sulphurea]|uniref:hypothetical protein n=1 Tax=Amycolatopsis sulphurea TaxID=76022 RepID=UPI001FE50628|nr:hypothetical protein [Amycolatopsis sulphurea]